MTFTSAAASAFSTRRRDGARKRRRALFGLFSRVGWMAVGTLTILVLAALLGPVIVGADPNSVSLSDAFGLPRAGHLLGFDSQGRDLLARFVHGGRSTLAGPALVVMVSTTLGTALGLLAAMRGGWFDAVISRVVDAMFAFPGLLLAILATALFDPSLKAAVLALAIAYTPYIARIVRGAALRERSLPYVSALTVQGFSGWTIALRHVFPNIATLVGANATLSFGFAVTDLAALSFIGLGVQAPGSDWGVMVASGVAGVLQHHPSESLIAGALIVLTVVSVNVIGDDLAARSEGRA